MINIEYNITYNIINKLFNEYNKIFKHFEYVSYKYCIKKEMYNDVIKLDTIYNCALIIDNNIANLFDWQLDKKNQLYKTS